MKPSSVHMSIKLDISNETPQGLLDLTRGIVSGLLSIYCRYHGLESVSSRIRRKTESRVEESETKSNFDNRLLAKIKINGFTNLLPRFIVRLRLIHMVQRLLKLSAHHTIWLYETNVSMETNVTMEICT